MMTKFFVMTPLMVRIPLLFCLLVAGSLVEAAPERIPEPATINLRRVSISDTSGKPAQFSEKGIIVFIEVSSKCPMVQRYVPTLNALKDDFSGQPVTFYLVNSALHDTRDSVTNEMARLKMDIPVLADANQLMAKSLGFKMSTQSAVIDSATNNIIYRGSIDDSLNYFGRKPASHHYLKDAINAALNGKLPDARTTRAYGCAITFR